jgi:GT2 family glycosyltransferase
MKVLTRAAPYVCRMNLKGPMPDMFDVTAAIVTFKNPPSVVSRAALSFLRAPQRVALHIIDNSPTDELRGVAEKCGAEYVFTGKNLGFGAAHNLAIARVAGRSRYHVVLNPDIYFEPEVIERLYCFMERNSDVGLVMPNVLYPDGSVQHLCKLLPSPFDLFARRFLPSFAKRLLQHKLDSFECRDIDLTSAAFVPYLSGSFMFLRADVLRRVGGFDERYFMYFEDTDLTRRIARECLTIFFPHVSVYHEFGRGSYKNLRLLAIHLINAVRYFNKFGWVSDPERSEMNRRARSQCLVSHLNNVGAGSASRDCCGSSVVAEPDAAQHFKSP